MKNERNYGLDIYRLLCMFLITSIHLGYTNIYTLIPSNSINYFFAKILKILQLFGVNGFVLISSFHLNDISINWKRIIRFWLKIVFCGLVIYIYIYSFFFIKNISIYNFIKSLFPITTQHYWYPISYIILLFLSPFLNIINNNTDRKQHLELLIVLIMIELFLTLNPMYNSMIYLGHSTHGIIWFITLYLIAGYIKKYGIHRKKLFGPILFFITLGIAFIMYCFSESFNNLIEYLPDKICVLINNISIFDCNSIFALLLSFSSFVLFSNIEIKNETVKKIIIKITPALMFVYLIQEHNSIRPIFWEKVECLFIFTHNPIILSLIAFLFLLACSLLMDGLYRISKNLFIDKIETFILSKILNIAEYFNNKHSD